MSILYKQILIFSTQTPKGLLCPINGTHRATFCNKNNVFSLLCLLHFWPRLRGLLCANVQGQDHFLSRLSTPCSMPLFPRLPGSQAPSCFSYPLSKGPCAFLSRAGISCYGQQPCIYTFVYSHNQQTLTERL